MNRIVPCLWFDNAAEDAAHFYTSIFRNATIGRIARYGEEGHEIHGRPAGSVMTVEFELDGYTLLGLNGGPLFHLTPAISLFAMFETEADIDAAWAALGDAGTVRMPLDAYDWSKRYGWLDDRYGVSWQLALGKRADIGQAIAPSLLFVGPQCGRAEEALEHYTAVFPDSRVEGILRHDGAGPDAAGTVMHAQFQLGGETFMVMDSAHPHDFGFTEATSLIVNCDTQDEIDHYWQALSAVPEAEQCGWLKDKFGVSWQIMPRILPELLTAPNPEASARVMRALLGMKKLDIAALKRAHGGE
jgi:predicted 3-demethylubiquinone-9 3-methyltransferase (glyoxalase superfamily)